MSHTPAPPTPADASAEAPHDDDDATDASSSAPVPTGSDADADADAQAQAQAQADIEAQAGPDDAEAPPPTQASGSQPAAAGAPSVTATADALKERFPALFAGPAKPFKLKIQADIQAQAPGVFGKQALSAFFRRHTGSTSYLVAITKAPHRFDLDGQPAGEITDEHRQAANEELARRRGVQQERRALEDTQRRNRATLLRDFERTTLTPANFCALKGVPPEELDNLLAIARREAAEAPPPRPDQGDRRPQDRRDGPPRHGQGRGPGQGEQRGPRGPGGPGPRNGGPRPR